MAGNQEEDADDKPFEASQKKLDEARRKGEVPHSNDLTTAGAYGGLLLVALALGGGMLRDLGTVLAEFLRAADPLSEILFKSPFASSARPVFDAVLRPIWAWFAVPALAAVLAVLAQRAFVVAPEKLVPKLERISPLAGAKNKFGRNGLFEFAKSTVKLILISAVLAIYCLWRLPAMIASMALDPGQVTALMLRLALEFMAIVFALTLMLGAVDAFWQSSEHQRKHRMSRKELADETKESEGDPWMKSRRRDRGVEIANNKMMADVPKSDVVIVNPTHYAVALRWDRHRGGAPVCVAKGVDEVALRIRSVATDAGVPIRHDPPTARAVHGLVEIGQEIAPEHYRAVAVAIRFAERVRGKSEARFNGP